jgi:hypothetical protein
MRTVKILAPVSSIAASEILKISLLNCLETREAYGQSELGINVKVKVKKVKLSPCLTN